MRWWVSPEDEALAAAIRRAAVDLPTGQLHKLADALERHPTPTSLARHEALGAVPTAVFRQHAAAIAAAWKAASEAKSAVSPLPSAAPSAASPLPGSAVALALRAAAGVAAEVREAQRVEVVWMGPASYEVPLRATSAVLADLIGDATRELLVVSFAAYKVPALLAGLAAATARGVDVRLILESAEKSNGLLSRDARHAYDTLGDAVAFYVWLQNGAPRRAAATRLCMRSARSPTGELPSSPPRTSQVPASPTTWSLACSSKAGRYLAVSPPTSRR